MDTEVIPNATPALIQFAKDSLAYYSVWQPIAANDNTGTETFVLVPDSESKNYATALNIQERNPGSLVFSHNGKAFLRWSRPTKISSIPVTTTSRK